MSRIFLAMILLLSASVANCQTQEQIEAGVGEDLCNHLTRAGNVKVTMPEQLRLRIMPEKQTAAVDTESQSVKTGAAGKMGGYRIQVFSDNNSRTAKGEARSRARNVSAQFPQHQTYVVYSSPYWRLRVGNFRTHDEANLVAEEMRLAFPSYAREIRVVRDRIVVEAD
ncbi:MAG: SPOR domain-containing protein [Muribaculum sp.]|nr:SPOR domain-containing protein [Muribaculum sp.]